jgi:hypothetical protein
VNWPSLSSYNPADLSPLCSDVWGPCAGKSGLRCGRNSNSLGRLGLCRSATLDVPPQAHKGTTLRIIGPTTLLRGLLPFRWTRGISVPPTTAYFTNRPEFSNTILTKHDHNSRKRLKACSVVYFYKRIQLSTACAISGGSLIKLPLEIVFLYTVPYESMISSGGFRKEPPIEIDF